jgi:uncharacterized protein (TIGR03118 family)
MALRHPHGFQNGTDLPQDSAPFVQDSPDDPGMVGFADLQRDLHRHDPIITFLQTNLVSDRAGLAPVTDPNLVNPWGMSSNAASPIWISQNGAGVTSLYSLIQPGPANPAEKAVPNLVRPAVGVLTAGGDPSTPTGQAFNPFAAAGAFKLAYPDGSNLPATFLFATQDGTITGWNSPAATPHTQTVVVASTPGAVYTGLGIDKAGDVPMLYAANFSQGSVDVFDANFNKINTITERHGSSNFAPFNAQVLTLPGIGGAPGVERLFVTFAERDALAPGGMDRHGHGFVNEYDLQGHLIERIDADGTLDTPWGLAIAPASFGAYAGDLLVGNHGDGTISVFDLSRTHDQALGHLLDGAGHEVTIDGLWGLIPGNGGAGGAVGSIYFTAGPQDGAHGLFGSLTPNPAPLSQIAMMGDH